MEKVFRLRYSLTKYQFVREIRSPVAGMIRAFAQFPLSGPDGVFASIVTPMVIMAKEAINISDCKMEAFQLSILRIWVGTEYAVCVSQMPFISA
jgi:hypothetical protein